MVIKMWALFALLSALFSSIMLVLIKVGLKNLDSDLGLAIRTIIVTVFCIINVLIIGKIKDIKNIDGKVWLWLLLGSIATYLTWLFYFKATKQGEAMNVIAISQMSIVFSLVLNFFFLKEKISIMDILGSLIVILGVYLIVYK